MAQRTADRKDMKKRVGKTAAKRAQKPAEPKTEVMKMTLFDAPAVPRSQTRERRSGARQQSGKRIPAPKNEKARQTVRRSLDPSDSSNDSGLGFDNHMESPSNNNDNAQWIEDRLHPKRQKVDVKLESDDINENYCFPERTNIYRHNTTLIRTAPSSSLTSLTVSNTQSNTSRKSIPRCLPLLNKSLPSTPITLTTQLQTVSRYSDISLSIVCQPEQQHRARYQTEGSRGAVKDRTGHGFPVVQLIGYNKPTTLQVFIGTDVGKAMPHMFYQACKVSGKNSTPCTEKKIDGTIVIELQLEPNKEMTATCDCVGILKERNVDVEHRFPDQLASRSKKKSTRCRMVFRTSIVHDDGFQETLQVCSQPIVCTQPPGVPEISKKSLTTCTANGGLELFIIGKNFLKDTMVYFQCGDDAHPTWEKGVTPDKEYLQQTHLVCVVPPYVNRDITESVNVRLYVVSSGKASEAHQFVYTPVSGSVQSVNTAEPAQPQPAPFLAKMWTSMTKHEQDVGMMPPPGTNMVPVSQRRSSLSTMSSGESNNSPPRSLKQEMVDENSQNSVMDASELPLRYRHISESSMDAHQGDSNISMINENSMDMGSGMSTSDNSNLTMDDLRRDEIAIMDLRLKLPMNTMEDLVNTKEPSMATLRSFGVTENNALTAQTAQSIENFLTNIEAKRENSFVKSASTFVTSGEERMFETTASTAPQSFIKTTNSAFVLPRGESIFERRTSSAFLQNENVSGQSVTFVTQTESIPVALMPALTKTSTFINTQSDSSSGFIAQTTENSEINFAAQRNDAQGEFISHRSESASSQNVNFVQNESIPVARNFAETVADNVPFSARQSGEFETQAVQTSSFNFIQQAETRDVNFNATQSGGFIARNETPHAGNFAETAESAAFLSQTETQSIAFLPQVQNETANFKPQGGVFMEQSGEGGQGFMARREQQNFMPQGEQQNGNFIPRTEAQSASFIPRTETQSAGFVPRTEAQGANFAQQIETQSTTFAQQIETQSTTFSQQIETQSTTFAQQIETQSSNFVQQIETQSPNFVQQIETQNGNFAQQIETQGSNFAQQIETQGSNFAQQIETQGGNFVQQPEAFIGQNPAQQNANFIPSKEQEQQNGAFMPQTGNIIQAETLQAARFIAESKGGFEVPANLVPAISPERLDALVNCAVETHITAQKSPGVLLSTRDVVLNAPLQPITLDTNQISPIPVESTAIILNSQIPPSIMCLNTAVEDKQQIFPDVNVADQDKQPIYPEVNVVNKERIFTGANEAEKAIILNAAVDLLETQQKICDMQTTLPEQNVRMINILTTSTSDGGLFKMSAEKKAEERMIPSSFATMSENDLINIINPSCFDQV